MQAIPLKWVAWCLQGVRVELDVNGSAGWLESEELDVLLLPLLAASQRKLPTEVLCSDETACAQRCAKAFLAVKVPSQSTRWLPCVSATVMET